MKVFWRRLHSDNRIATVFYGAVGSLLASAIIKYSPSALTIVGEYTFGLLTKFIDSRYAKAATLEPTNYSYFLLALIFVVIVIAWIEISGAVKKILSEKSSQEVEEPKIKDNTQPPKWVPVTFFGVRMLVWFYLAWGLLYVAGESTVLNATTDFKQHLRIVSPYIESKEKDLLLSEWSQMRGIEDYNNIYKKLIEISKENDLTLYRNRQY
tara:strand:- start:1565 stop:2194 length:630 start_codon:yes stop_codon:yes gene_type:complete